jgi:uncharacterized RDD family membrane protein YckC
MKAIAALRRKGVSRRRGFDEGWRELVTPEGVDLRLRIATFAERAAAFLIDAAIQVGVLIALTLLSLLTFWALQDSKNFGETVAVIWLLGAFALRNFYFMAFEGRHGGATPGKRAMGLRVAARNGGRLTADAVFARNAMREIEVFLPLSFLSTRGYGVDGALITLGAIWSGVFVVFPLFNRDRLRLGDLAAGTMVVKAPKMRLRPDLADNGPAVVQGWTFTEAQLGAYGVKELHVLERVLRTGERKTMAEVARRIRTKIDWQGPSDLPDRTFLAAYYSGLRGRLETRLLFGHRRRDKHDRA